MVDKLKLQYYKLLELFGFGFQEDDKIGGRSTSLDHALQIDKISSTYIKQLELGVYLIYDL